MNRYNIIVISLMLSISSTVNTKKRRRCPAPSNYKGMLTTLRDNDYSISHISIANKQHCIPVYTAPCNTHTIVTNLSYNPKQCKSYIDLAKVTSIEMPYPYAEWIYRSCDRREKDKYILIKITWRNKKKCPTHYLIQPKRRLTARIQKKLRATNCQIPFRGFKKIIIEA